MRFNRMNLIADIGNTRAKLSITQGGKILAWEQAGDDGVQVMLKLLDAYPETSNAIVSSVRNDISGLLQQLNARVPHVVELSAATSIPIRVDYRTPETLGMDRIAAAVGAWSIYPGEELLVIDAGTAITMDRVSSEGIFLGGKISPGLRMRFEALHSFTDKLPLVDAFTQWTFPGKETREAIAGGVLEGTIYELTGTIGSLQKQYPQLKVIITGGDADFFAKNLKSPIFVHFNLNITGLDRILEYNT
jgi:type III pantothenate kinase